MGLLIILMPVVAYLTLHFPSVQSFAAKQAAGVLSKNLNTQVGVKKVYFVFFNKLILGNVHILSTPSDTLMSVNKLSITFSKFNPFARKATLQKALLQGGVFHLLIEEDRLTNLERVFNIEKGDRTAKDTAANTLALTLREFSLRDFRFTLKDEQRWRQGAFPDVIDFLDLDVSNIRLDAKKIRLEHDTLFCSLTQLSASEKSGYAVDKMSAEIAVSGSGVRVLDLTFRDKWSDIRANAFYMHYRSARDFKTFVDSVRLEARFDNALLSFQSLSFYAPAIVDNYLAAYVSGHVEGPVRHLRGKGLNIRSAAKTTSMDIDFRISGLPSASLTTAFLDIHRCSAQAGDIADILSQINGMDPTQITQYIPPSSSIQLEGRLAGLLTNFAATGTLTTEVGDISFDAVLYQEKERGFHINGHLGTQDLHLENIVGNPFGALTMHTHTHATLLKGESGNFEAEFDNLRIEKIVINNYPFTNIIANGKYERQRFDGRVVCSDPNLNFIFQGLANLDYRELREKQTSRYDFQANIAFADLAAIGVDVRDSVSRFSGTLLANFQRTIDDDVTGFISIQNADYTNSSGVFHLGAVHIDSHVHDSVYRFTLSAPFAKADYVGSRGIPTFIKELRNNTLSKYLPNYFSSVEEEHSNRQYRLDVTVYDMLAIGQFVLPGLYIAPQTQLTATLSSHDSITCSLRSRYIRYHEQKASNLSVDLIGDALALRSMVSASELQALGQLIDTVDLRLNAAQNRVDVRFDYTNEEGQNSGGTVNANIQFINNAEVVAHLLPSHFIVDNAIWELGTSDVFFTPKEVYFGKTTLYNAYQSLTMEGTLAKERSDTLHITLNQFDISLGNLFLEKTPHRFAGTVTGEAKVIDFYQNRQISMEVEGTDIFVNNIDAGQVSISCLWNHQAQRFQIGAYNLLQGRRPVNVSGYYYPDSKWLNLSASLQDLSVSYFEPFLNSLISDLDGTVSGNLNLNGALHSLHLTSNRIDANDVSFTVLFTQTPYKLNAPVILHEDGFTLQDGTLTDRYGNRGVVNGGLKYRFFRDIAIDASVEFTNMQCLATKERDNDYFYGDVFATGRLHATGNLKQVMLDILAKTEKNSTLHIPLSNTSEAKQSTRLSFAAPSEVVKTPFLDPLDTIQKSVRPNEPTQVAVALKADVTSDAEVLIEINKATGNVISGFGLGNISISVDPNRDIFDIFGDYTLSNGEYQFVLQGIWSRKFFVIPGGKITFNGDIFKTNLDLTAAYRTKASLNTLLANSNTTGGMRDVECLIRMNGNMLNPNLGFDIEIKDLAPDIRSRVDAAFTPDDKKIRQFMALLVSGGFVPDQTSGIVNNTSILYSNATEILTNQLNNIFGQLNIPLDVGFNYQPGNQGRDIYDVAVSTQLFNNRVIVNGNLGNAQALGGTTGDVAGNIDIEVKITDSGNFRVKAFSRSADQYSNYKDLDNTQRNGAGIIYQEEFNTFRELFNRIFVRKKRSVETL